VSSGVSAISREGFPQRMGRAEYRRFGRAVPPGSIKFCRMGGGGETGCCAPSERIEKIPNHPLDSCVCRSIPVGGVVLVVSRIHSPHMAIRRSGKRGHDLEDVELRTRVAAKTRRARRAS
jgi:hypothetical protein